MDNMRQRDKTSPFKIRISVFVIYQIYDVVLRFTNKSQDNVNTWKFNKTNFIWNTIHKKTIRAQTRYATYSETRDRLCSSISESNSQSSASSKTLDHVWSDLPSSYKIFLKRVLNSRSLANRVNVSMCVVWYDIATGDQRTIGSAMVWWWRWLVGGWMVGRVVPPAGALALSSLTQLRLPCLIMWTLYCCVGVAVPLPTGSTLSLSTVPGNPQLSDALIPATKWVDNTFYAVGSIGYSGSGVEVIEGAWG